MTEPLLQNSSSWNNTGDSEDRFMCTTRYTVMYQIWLWCCLICFVLGTPASLGVLRELFRRHREGACNDFFMLNLYITDLIFTAILLLVVYNMVVLRNLILFRFNSFIHCLPVCGRPLLMACICGDCYFAVVHPIKYKTSKNVNMIRKVVGLMVWTSTFYFGGLLCTVKSVYTRSLISAPLVVALPVIIFCNISILCSLRKADPSGSKTIHPQKKQALDTIFCSSIMTCVSYLPPVIIFLFADVMPISRDEFFCILSYCGICFYIVGCVALPLQYLYSIGKMDDLKSWLRKQKGFLFFP